MPEPSSRRFPNLQRIAQINSYYCGPATIQMLFSAHNVFIDQQQVVDTLGIHQKVVTHGMTVHELGQFVAQSYPQFQFWYKFNSTISDLSQLINTYNCPVGVEWQGIFDYPDDDILEDEDDDPGHVSVITGINTNENYIYIADPDSHYAGTDRKLSILQFERRWWDINEIIDPFTHHRREIDDFHALFIITPTESTFPETLHLTKI